MRRYDVFLSDGHRLTTNEDGYRAIRGGFGASGAERLVRIHTVRGDRLSHAIEVNVDHVVTISAQDD